MKQVQLISFILVAAILLGGGLIILTDSSDDDDKINITVTLPWQKEMVDMIGGELVSVTYMRGPGSDPHVADDTKVSDIVASHKSVAFLYIGAGMTWEDDKLPIIKSSLPDLQFVNISEGVDLIPKGAGFDGHVWTLPDNLLIIANNTKNTLIELDPGNETIYVQGYEEYIAEVDRIKDIADTRIIEGNDFLVYHSAWQYFAEGYELNEISIEDDSGDMSPNDIATLNDSIKTMFVSPSDKFDKDVWTGKGYHIKDANPLSLYWLAELENFINMLADSWEAPA